MDQSMTGRCHYLILALMLTGFGFRLAQAQLRPAPIPDGKSAMTPADVPIGVDQQPELALSDGTQDRVASVSCANTDCACPLPRDCSDILLNQSFPPPPSGVYQIYVRHMRNPVWVYCDMTTDGGGWTVFQRRTSNTIFWVPWSWYKSGFGTVPNHWLGLHNIHAIMSVGSRYQLRIDMSYNSFSRYAVYDDFKIGPLGDKYRLTVSGYSGNAGDSLSQHSGYQFTTWDQDNDAAGFILNNPTFNCALNYKGGWWYHGCHTSNLNGFYTPSIPGDGIVWSSWLGFFTSLTSTEMKFRRYDPDI